MRDKLAPMFAEEIARRFAPDPPPLERVEGGIFALRDRVFLANADPDLATVLGICLRRFFRAGGYCLSTP